MCFQPLNSVAVKESANGGFVGSAQVIGFGENGVVLEVNIREAEHVGDFVKEVLRLAIEFR